MYEERWARVPEAVLWWQDAPGPAPGSGPPPVRRVLPDGCMDLIWMDGALVVAGPDTAAHLVRDRAGSRYVGLRFGPGTAPGILGVAACELRDRRVPLAEVWPEADARRLSERAAEAADPGAVLEEAALGRIRAAGGPADTALISAVVGGVRAGLPVAELAAGAGLGVRQLHRRCLDAFGYGPKTLGRILRMNHALALARRGMPYVAVAGAAGYADQAHLAREVKSLTGATLGELTR
ncbi:helix-turn-helix domain-containing protein [Microbispora sp. H10949]|uniref:helix-turn-helix domain-containing protein n=1 Tax=Microbispora sp. H10949 TaxID=2729111 RepID=UPI001C725586|nr:helix-turn-helix domain-containing protein [Microbispora sp. H10949]